MVLALTECDAEGFVAVEAMNETVLEPGYELQSDTAVQRGSFSTLEVVEMLLKNRERLNALCRDEVCQRELVPRFLAIALIGFAIYGVVMTLLLNWLRVRSGFWFPHVPEAFWTERSAANLTIAYTLGLVAAQGICLPSFYFYTLLAGVPVTMLAVTTHAVKGMAACAVTLVGLLPIYVATALAAIVFPWSDYYRGLCFFTGLSLPWLAGFSGAANLYQGFAALADTIHCGLGRSRACFLRRLVLAWVGCAAVVTPAVTFSLWDLLSGLTR